MDVRERTAANRHRLADFFDGLTEEQLDQDSLCGAWTVREVLGHLVTPLVRGLPALVIATVQHGGSVNRASEAMARDQARRPVAELTGLLRARAERSVKAPGVGPMGQMADGCIHLRDCARPLGLPDDVTTDDWRLVLDWMAGGVPGLVPRSRLRGLALVATDTSWQWGRGDRVVGPIEALAMVVAGRSVALADVTGPGVRVLGERGGARGL